MRLSNNKTKAGSTLQYMQKNPIINISLLPLLFLLGCSENAQDQRDAISNALIGHEYVLDSADGFTPAEDVLIRIEFYEGKNDSAQLDLSTGCNGLDNGVFSIEEDALIISDYDVTEMYCEELDAQEQWLISFITAEPLVDLGDDSLTLTASDATLFFLQED